jgi:hypothetical protein
MKSISQRFGIVLLFSSFLVLASGTASAAKKRGKVVELDEITITGRVQKPIAAVEISRLAPKLSLGELRQPFLDKIEKSISKAPF